MPTSQARISQARTGLILLLLCAALPALAQTPASRASALMKRKLYGDALKVLAKEIEGQPESKCATKYLMIGECLYLQGKYADARPWYAKALRNLGPGRNQAIAEYRLACIAFRTTDPDGAVKATEAFVRKYPDDKRSGKLLLFKMKALVPKGKAAVQELEATRQRLQQNAGKYGPPAAWRRTRS